mmetsp:Transcript_9031/g.16679  ORF Transcript_9031/g.16679 Transcript_9031/m.16679 type:complete len:381 (+) Transcript_9031:128-1270(+)
MAGAVPREVLTALVGKLENSLQSADIRTLKLRRKFLLWKMRDFRGSIGVLSDGEKETLYSALVKISTQVDKLREGKEDPKWLDTLYTFFASRDAVSVFEDEIKKADDVVTKALKLQKKIGQAKGDAVADHESDLRTDLVQTNKELNMASFDDTITSEARKALQNAKVVFGKAIKNKNMNEVATMLSERHGEFAKLKEQVKKLAIRDTTAPDNPALTKDTTPRVFMLDLSLDYSPIPTGGFWFNKNKDGSHEMLECYVFLPGCTTQVEKRWVKYHPKKRFSLTSRKQKTAMDFKVTVDDKVYWEEKDYTKSSDSKSFRHDGHDYTVGYRPKDSIGGQVWSTTIDGGSYEGVLSHQQWADARNLHSYNMTMASIMEAMKDDA